MEIFTGSQVRNINQLSEGNGDEHNGECYKVISSKNCNMD